MSGLFYIIVNNDLGAGLLVMKEPPSISLISMAPSPSEKGEEDNGGSHVDQHIHQITDIKAIFGERQAPASQKWVCGPLCTPRHLYLHTNSRHNAHKHGGFWVTHFPVPSADMPPEIERFANRAWVITFGQSQSRFGRVVSIWLCCPTSTMPPYKTRLSRLQMTQTNLPSRLDSRLTTRSSFAHRRHELQPRTRSRFSQPRVFDNFLESFRAVSGDAK